MRKRIVNTKERRGGVALIISVGILALLAMIATSFAINMQLEYRAAVNQLNYTKATVLAEAGIEKVMADIREKAKTSAYSEVITAFPDDYTTGEVTLGDGTYEVTIEREDQKVNINALDETDYPWIKKLTDASLSPGDIAEIIDYRDADSNVTTDILDSTGGAVQPATGSETDTKNAPYSTIEELRLVLDDTKYNAIKDIVTVSASVIRGGLIGKYYLNRTSWSKDTILNLSYYKGKVTELGKVRELWLAGTDSWEETHDAEWAGGYLVNEQFGIEQFGVRFTGFIYVPQNKVGTSINFYLRSDDGSRLWLDSDRVINMWQDQTMTEGSVSYTFNSAGWHPIVVEYYDQGGTNGCELKWDGLGSKDYVPAEYFGYYPPACVGPAKPATTATETTYNSAGCYKVTSTGKAKTPAGDVLAKKKITTQMRIFGAWTQTTRAEFYAPWFSTINDFSDGEVLNMTWLENCPTTEGTSPNALKLGFWDNFDEDCAYSVNNLREERLPSAPVNDDSNWNKFQDWDGDGDREFSIAVEQNANKAVELNGYYYYVDDRTGYDLFTQCWEIDADSPSERTATPWDVGWFNPKHSFILQGESDFKGGKPNLRNYYNLMKQDYTPIFGSDRGISELNLNSSYELISNSQVDINPYRKAKTLRVVGKSNNFQAYIDGTLGAQKSRSEDNPACAVLSSYNADRQDDPLNSGNWQDQGPLTTYWDDFSWIPQKGFFVSTPFCEIVNAEEGAVSWGHISWNEVLPSGKGISLEGRAADALTGFTSDPSTWGSWGMTYSSSSGQALNLNNAKFFQYKVIMTDTTQDGFRPVFKDVTITYLPGAETLYQRTEIE